MQGTLIRALDNEIEGAMDDAETLRAELDAVKRERDELREALEQANATAEVASGAGRQYACLPETIELASIETMRGNKRRLLG